MHPLLHSWSRAAHRLTLVRSIPLIPLLLAALWLVILHRGERSAFTSAITACRWSAWETWSEDARPHRAVLIADPQLVDPHTYPGRPWPLSSLTERYTDRYMARSYRIINEQHDPDSIIFLGDMLDGGREWEPKRARKLNNVQKWQLSKASPRTDEVPKDAMKMDMEDPGWNRHSAGTEKILESQGEADEDGPIDVTAFVHGEGGRWKGYGNRQWEAEYKRFGDIFLSPQQLYPKQNRSLQPYEVVQQDPVSTENGAKINEHRTHYAILGLKTKTVLASLPGNHDLGFGSGVQMPVRARYKWHFGDLNRLDILGNHSFVSIDALSLAAWSQYENHGQQSTTADAKQRKHIYAQAQQFLDNVPALSQKATQELVARLYPASAAGQQEKLLHVAEDISSATWSNNSIEDKSKAVPALPLVLLTHVPLYRAPDTSCGPLRERGHALSITGGYQYQNVLTPTLSEEIAKRLAKAGRFEHVFSGDDHDYCSVMHTYDATSDAVQEETVKSFSWAMGVRRPGFLMVSLWNPLGPNGESSIDSTVQSHLCLLPDQLGIFVHYATMAGLTALVLLVRAVVLALRGPASEEAESNTELIIPMLQKIIPSRLRRPDGILSKTTSKHRHRASSSGLKPMSNSHLGVQRSANARARSISPGVGLLQAGTSPFSTPTKPLIEQAGYYRPDTSDDEESGIGDMDYLQVDDSQAKWRRRRRARGRLRRAVDEFVFGLSIIGGVAMPFYIILISRG